MSNKAIYSTKKITIHYLITLSIVALLGGSAYILMITAIERLTSDAIVINLSGRQRMLSQKLTKELLLLIYHDTDEGKVYYLRSLKDTLAEWSRVHKGLKSEDRELKLPGNNSKEIRNLFKELDPYYERMREELSKVILMSPSELTQLTTTSPLIQEILKSSSSYLSLMDRIVFQYDREEREDIKGTMKTVTYLTFTAFILLILTGLFVIRPMTKRIKVTLYKLYKSEEHYRSLVENSLECICHIDLYGRIVYMNPTGLKLNEFNSLEDIKGKDFTLIVKEEYKGAMRDALKRAKDGEVVTLEYASKTVSRGNRWYESIISPIKDDKGNVVDIIKISRDITQQKEMDAKLREAQKMEAIALLAGGVVHDFNNLLTTIKGYTELTMMKLDEGNPLYRNLKQIHNAAMKGASLTSQLLLFSRRKAVEIAPLNLNSIIDGLLKMLTALVGEEITINYEFSPDLWMVNADKGGIEQVVINLVINARDAMPQGGRLTIRLNNVEIDDDYCRLITYAHPGSFVCLSVEDTGIGMDKEVIEHIFEPFFTRKEVGKGTGLGLSVVYGIVKQHRGFITVDSELGKGSIFKVYLPASKGSKVKGDEATKKVSLQGLQDRGERILIVEDEKEVRGFIKEALSENGYIVSEAKDAEDALTIFEMEKGNFHLILSDVVMSGKGGLELAEELLSRKPGLKVILSSGYSDYKAKLSLIYEKGYRFLHKPYSIPDLLRAIREAIGD